MLSYSCCHRRRRVSKMPPSYLTPSVSGGAVWKRDPPVSGTASLFRAASAIVIRTDRYVQFSPDLYRHSESRRHRIACYKLTKWEDQTGRVAAVGAEQRGWHERTSRTCRIDPVVPPRGQPFKQMVSGLRSESLMMKIPVCLVRLLVFIFIFIFFVILNTSEKMTLYSLEFLYSRFLRSQT